MKLLVIIFDIYTVNPPLSRPPAMSTRFLWSRQNPYYFHIKFPAYLDIANSTPPPPRYVDILFLEFLEP